VPEIKRTKCDVLIVGGGTSGCRAAAVLAKEGGISVVLAEKAHIERSGCLASGVNALNAYIPPGHTPMGYVEYAMRDAGLIARGDLLESVACRFNREAEYLESLGLAIHKNPDGSYKTRGNRNIPINGENIKPILAKAAAAGNVAVANRVAVIDYLADGGAVCGAIGVDAESETICVYEASAVICAAGGASGLYRPNNPGFSRHKTWYPPFNAGAGYAMGIRAGAEMTTFEMRFIALRCKDTIAPTGTIAQGIGARQVNANGEEYEPKYGTSTWERLYGTVREARDGNGPCFLRTRGISPEQEEQLLKAYLNMAPSQTLRWLESGRGPAAFDVEIEGTEPYIVGGHTAAGYWIDTKRQTTLRGLYAAGDVAGGCPQKYVTGAMAEGEIAASSAAVQIRAARGTGPRLADFERLAGSAVAGIDRMLSPEGSIFTCEQIEEAMQGCMDRDAGGITQGYRYSSRSLSRARDRLDELEALSRGLRAGNMKDVVRICELKDRILVSKCLIAHLEARRETRWGSFADYADYPGRDDERFMKYVNSAFSGGNFKIIYRDLVGAGETYEHQD
jgi:adenylylsulfate reductase subunit A